MKGKAEKIHTDENVLYIIGWILILFLTVAAVIMMVCPQLWKGKFPPCLFHLLTGLYCPGCGGTRAVITLSQGKLLTSVLYHPFVPYVALVGGWFMISQTLQRLSKGKLAIGMKYRDIYLWIALALVAVNFLVKNILLLGGIDVLKLLE